eukprot:Polyplicarium_translucidae@DN737_c0_g1_i1.p1
MQGRKHHDCSGYARLACTAASMLTPAVAFVLFVLPHAARSTSGRLALVTVALSLILAVFVFFLGASFTEPGCILPRHDAERQQIHPGREITMNGVVLISKWCPDCNIYRPPRAKHCHVCKCCVQRFDHHCPWLSNCIGLRNYRYFFGFVVALSIFATLVFATDIAATVQIVASKHLSFTFAHVSKELLVHPLMLVLLVVSGCILCPLFNLSFFHCYLVSKNLTTGEEMRNMYRNRNPFSLGLITNCRQSLCENSEISSSLTRI